MKRHDDHFSPNHIDEQIEQQAWESSPVPSQLGPTQDLLRALHALYEEEKNEDARILDRAWSRLAAVDDRQQRNRSQKNVRLMMKEPGSFAPRQFERPVQRPLTQRLGILVAVAFLVLLLGGAVFMFTSMTTGRNTHTGGSGPLQVTPIASPTPPHPAPSPTSPHPAPSPTPPHPAPSPTPRGK